ncbi:hypothetical protein KR222_006647 [Zaprionus bogoriensis]|nr:hypothetical protein KR222_006647 [Zaprionus bogoriensis]
MKLIVLSAFCVAALALVSADSSQSQPQLLGYDSNVEHNGKFRFSYHLDNGQEVVEQGELKNIEKADAGGEAVKGQYSWEVDGEKYSVTYIADENGFQPIGDHLPTPPPTPESVLKALQYIKDHPPKTEA